MRLAALLLILLAVSVAAWAEPSPFGYWQTEDGGGVIHVFACGDRLCARLAGIVLDHPGDAMPTDWQGQSRCGFPLITDARPKEANLWRGHITDPRDGHVYGVEVHVDRQGRLAVRGFLGIALLGRTDHWHRYPDAPPADCRMTPADRTRGETGQAAAAAIPAPVVSH